MTNWWFEKDKDACHKAVMTEILRLSNEYNSHRENYFLSLRHYNNKYFTQAIKGSFAVSKGNTSANTSLAKTHQSQSANKLSFNMIRNAVDTLVGKITKNPLNISCLPLKYDPVSERGAQAVEKFVKGYLKDLDIHQVLRNQFRHAAIAGDGWIKIFYDPNKGESGDICIEPVLNCDILIPPEFGLYGKSPVAYQFKMVNKYEFAALFPEHEEMILQSGPIIGESKVLKKFFNQAVQKLEDNCMIEVVEAWYVKSPESPEGRHVIIVSNGMLVDETYPEEDLPLVPMYFNRPPVGIWGLGIAELGRGLQIELNAYLMSISENVRLCGKPKWFVAKGSMVAPHMLSNKIEIVEYNAGNGLPPPQLAVVNPFPAQVMEMVNWLYQKFYSQLGLSEMSATSQKPAGLNSGVAIQAAIDVESERFIELQQEFERVGKIIVNRIIYLAKRHFKSEDNRVVKALGRGSFEEIAWNSLKLDELKYHLDVQPMSNLPETRAGKIAFSMDMVNLGVVQDPSQVLEFMEIPGADKFFNTMLADKHLADEYIARLGDVNFEYPEPAIEENHQVMLKYIGNYYKTRRFNEDAEEVRERFKRHIAERSMIIEMMQPPAPPPAAPPAPGPAPGGMPPPAGPMNPGQ